MTADRDGAGERDGAGPGPVPGPAGDAPPGRPAPPAGPERRRARQQRKQMLLRLDPAVHDALAAWAAAELRSTNAQVEFLLRRALAQAGRLPGAARPIARRGRPPGPREGRESVADEDPDTT
ncbi:hypothetical protein [Streptomyces zingiberis]|uniref:Toxin-antitoxin system HicB family antitoxin n=1 Tax=Streptomyces zingiberis TaxID=2053010 RepID=A0ABX1BVM2_9ACTN|nr:hypothetical protein [Streptomyces zingiberis]NJQ00491.1 hypothetical protein [Streptomyces zingiberis]